MWILLTLVAAFATATRDPIYKKLLTADVNPYVLGGAQFVIAGALLGCISFAQGFPQAGSGFLFAVAMTVILNIGAVVLHFKAIKMADISLVAPLLSLIPAFAIPASYFILGESPSLFGFFGIALIVIGAYVLNWNFFGESLHALYRRVRMSPAIWYMLLVAVIFSVSSNFDKIAAVQGTPLFASAIIDLLLGSALLVLSPLHKRAGASSTFTARSIPWLLVLGLLFAGGTWAQNTAFTLEIVPYVSALLRTSALLSVFYGAYLFGEGYTRWRLIGALVMLGGVALLAF